jgi:hypothetical protein
MRWPTWLRRSTGRHRAVADLAAAQAADAAEQAAARERIIALARQDPRPGWNAPTAVYRPLMTRGQAARGHGGRP